MMDEDLDLLPCPFCGWEKIRFIEEDVNDKNHLFNGSKFTYCWCKVCGTRGPWAYSIDDDMKDVIKKCANRWNERNGE